MKGETTRWLKLAFGLVAAAGFVWLLARGLDPAALARAFSRLSVRAVLLALAFMAGAHALRIVRWWWMLRALEPDLPASACIRPFLASMAINNLLPLRAGDALRVLGFRRQLRSPAMRVLGTLVVERALDLVFLSGIFFVCLLGLPAGAFPPHFVTATVWLAGAGMAVLLASMLFLPAIGHLSGHAFRSLHERLPGRFLAGRRWPAALSRQGAHLTAALGIVRSTPRTLALLALSAVVWVCEGGAFVVLAEALMPGAAPLGPWLSLAAGTLATALPAAPGYVGTFDYFAALGFSAYGAAPETAVALALTVHALWVPLTAVGLACYWLPSAAGNSTASHPASSQPWNTTASPTCRTEGVKRRSPPSAK